MYLPVQWPAFKAFFASLFSHLDVYALLKGTIPPFLFIINVWCNVLILNSECMGRDEVLESLKEVHLRLVGREGLRKVISMENNAVVITVHHDRRNCTIV